MWLVISIPLMILGCGIAIVPVLWGSLRQHRGRPVLGVGAPAPGSAAVPERPMLEVMCPPCGTTISGRSRADLVRAVDRHAWAAHGVPSHDAVVEHARVA